MSSVQKSRPRAGASIDYSSKGYWTSRFEREETFEWLASSAALLPHITKALDELDKNALCTIHIGCGNSELSLELRRCVAGRSTSSNIDIINVDYAVPVLKKMQAAEIARFGDSTMRWEALDLLDWEAVRHFSPVPEHSIILDKSCADAIACGETTQTTLLSSCPDDMHPVEVLALHLAATALPGSVWLAISYSSSRFDFLVSQDEGGSRAREFWRVEYTEQILAQTESRENVHAPEVYHTLFGLRRTAKEGINAKLMLH